MAEKKGVIKVNDDNTGVWAVSKNENVGEDVLTLAKVLFSPAETGDASNRLFMSLDVGSYDIYLADIRPGVSVTVRTVYGIRTNELEGPYTDEKEFAVSPNADKLAFVREFNPNNTAHAGHAQYELWLCDLNIDAGTRYDCSNGHRVLDTGQIDNDSSRWPCFSADGERIFFASELDGGGDYEVYAIDVDGKNRVRITDNSFADSRPACYPREWNNKGDVDD